MPPLRVDLAGLRERYDAGDEVPAMPRRHVHALVGAGVALVVAYVVVVVGVLGEPLFRLLPVVTPSSSPSPSPSTSAGRGGTRTRG